MKEIINDETIDLIIADPPYFKVIGEKWDYQWRTEEDYIEWSKKWIGEAVDKLRKGGCFYLFGYFRILAKLLPILEAAGLSLRQQIVIDKGIKAVSGRATKNYKMFPNVTESILFLYKDPKPFVRTLLADIDFYEEKPRYHPTQKPQKLITRLLNASSNPGDFIMDPFMGGGSTAIACINENRKFVGFEIDYEYYTESLSRIETEYFEMVQCKENLRTLEQSA